MKALRFFEEWATIYPTTDVVGESNIQNYVSQKLSDQYCSPISTAFLLYREAFLFGTAHDLNYALMFVDE